MDSACAPKMRRFMNRSRADERALLHFNALAQIESAIAVAESLTAALSLSLRDRGGILGAPRRRIGWTMSVHVWRLYVGTEAFRSWQASRHPGTGPSPLRKKWRDKGPEISHGDAPFDAC